MARVNTQVSDKVRRLAAELGIVRPPAEMKVLLREAEKASDPRAFLAGAVEPEVEKANDATPGVLLSRPALVLSPEPRPNAYCQRHVDVQLSDARHVATFRRLRDGCVRAGVTLRNGREVKQTADVLRYMLECIEDGVPDAAE